MNSRSPNFSTTTKSLKQSTYKSFIPSNYLNPDLYLLMEFELQSPPSPSKNRLLYLICAFATFTFASLGLWAQFSEVQQASQNIQNKVYDDYSVLINN